MDLVIGIDGGGSTTRAVVAGLDGSIVAQGSAGGSNVYDHGIEAARTTIGLAVERAFAGCPDQVRTSGVVRACFAGVAGAGMADAAAELASGLAREFKLDRTACEADRDVRNAHAGALAGAPGAVIIAGTGSVCYGRTREGGSASAGGWGALIDDPGSGAWLGLRGLRAVVRAADGRAIMTGLSGKLLATLQVDSPKAMLRLLRGGKLDRPMLAGLAPVVLAAAEEGDDVAGEIADIGARELAMMLAAVAQRLQVPAEESWPVALVGGLVQAHAAYRNKVAIEAGRVVPNADLREPLLPPSGGAVLLALAIAGTRPGPAVLDRVRRGVGA